MGLFLSGIITNIKKRSNFIRSLANVELKNAPMIEEAYLYGLGNFISSNLFDSLFVILQLFMSI
jgi:hypothetical protein